MFLFLINKALLGQILFDARLLVMYSVKEIREAMLQRDFRAISKFKHFKHFLDKISGYCPP